jgi:hypothetical protein
MATGSPTWRTVSTASTGKVGPTRFGIGGSRLTEFVIAAMSAPV